MPATVTLKVRVTADVKQRFEALAERREISVSDLLRRLIDDLLAADRQALQSFARARSLRETTYLAMLIRSHVRSATPLPRAALHALRESAIELRTVSRRLDLLCRVAKGSAPAGNVSLTETRSVISACERLRDRTSDFIKANIQSWETGHAEADRYPGSTGRAPAARDPGSGAALGEGAVRRQSGEKAMAGSVATYPSSLDSPSTSIPER